MVIFYKKWEKHNKIQLTKNKMDLNNQKMTNHPPSTDGTEIVGMHLGRGNTASVHGYIAQQCPITVTRRRSSAEHYKNQIGIVCMIIKIATRDALMSVFVCYI